MSNYIIVSANYPPHVGGVDRYSQKVAHELAERGNQVIILTSSLEGQPENEWINENLEIIRMPSLWFLGDRMPVLRQTKAWREVRKRLAQIENPRMIIQTFLYPLSYAGARLARQMKWPFIVINHGCNYVCQGNGAVDKAEHIYEEILSRMVVWRSGGCYAVSEAAGSWVKHFSLPFAGVLSNAIDTEGTLKRLSMLPEGFRDARGIDKKAVAIAYVGRLIPEKGIMQLVHAVRRLIDEGRDVVLITAGDGPLLEELRNRETERIIFLGNTDHDDVLRLLRESDICCLPSDSEGFPTVLLEAALCRSYLIGSPYGGTAELIGSNEYGMIMPGNTQEDTYNALRKLLDGEIDRKQSIENAFKRVNKMFSWKSTCDTIEALDWDIEC